MNISLAFGKKPPAERHNIGQSNMNTTLEIILSIIAIVLLLPFFKWFFKWYFSNRKYKN
jgi:hypothetical protein